MTYTCHNKSHLLLLSLWAKNPKSPPYDEAIPPSHLSDPKGGQKEPLAEPSQPLPHPLNESGKKLSFSSTQETEQLVVKDLLSLFILSF